MKTQLIATTLCALAALAAGPATAQYMKPGLWHFTTTTHGKGDGPDPMAAYVANMQKEMAAMDPAARKEVEAMLAGLAANDTKFTRDGLETRACISKDEVQSLDKLMGKDGHCTTQRSPLVAGQIKLNVSCTRPPSTGSAVIKFQGDTGYSMESTMTGNFNGQRMTQKLTSTGKWLSSNCGKVKPHAGKD